MPYPKISADQIDQQIHAFEQTPAAQPVEQQQEQNAGISPVLRGAPAQPVDAVTPPAPNAPKPDTSGMVQDVAKNQTALVNSMPPPQIPWGSVLQAVVPAAISAAVGHAIFGGEKGQPKESGVPPVRKEPQMDVNTAGPQEPVLIDPVQQKIDAEIANPTMEQQIQKNIESARPTNIPESEYTQDVGKNFAPEDVNLMSQSARNKSANQHHAAGLEKGKTAPKEVVSGNVIPEGMHAQYKRNTANPIGPSAFNHLVNNKGLEEATKIWEDVYGKTNVPYEQFMEKYSKEAGKNMHGPRTPLPEGTKPGGTFGKSEFIPEYIRGSTPTGNLKATGTAAVGAALAYPAIKEAMHLAKKGEYTKAANTLVPFSAAIPPLGALMAPLYTSTEERASMSNMSMKELKAYKKAVGAGRGIAPPSSYKQP